MASLTSEEYEKLKPHRERIERYEYNKQMIQDVLPVLQRLGVNVCFDCTGSILGALRVLNDFCKDYERDHK